MTDEETTVRTIDADSGNRPCVGIVVRTKDRPRLLERALQSIGSQHYEAWECIVVNDGGDPEVLDGVVAAAPEAIRRRVRVIHHAAPRGRWQSANAGVLATTAPLLVLHDDDDTWHPDFLETATAYLAANPARDGVVSRTEIVWEEYADGAFRVQRRETFQPNLHDLLLSDALLFNRYVPIGFVYRRSLHTTLGLYDESLPVVGDWSFNLKVLSRGPLEFLGDRPLAYWHQRAEAQGTNGNSVVEARGDHERFDALIRDSELRAYVEREGLGLPLYLTKFIDHRLVQVEAGMRHELALGGPVIRRVRRLRDALLARRRR